MRCLRGLVTRLFLDRRIDMSAPLLEAESDRLLQQSLTTSPRDFSVTRDSRCAVSRTARGRRGPASVPARPSPAVMEDFSRRDGVVTRVRKAAAVAALTPLAAATIAIGASPPADAASGCWPLAHASINAPSGALTAGSSVHVSAQISGMLLQAHVRISGPGLDQQVGASGSDGTIGGDVTIRQAGYFTLAVIGNGTGCTYATRGFSVKDRPSSPSRRATPRGMPTPPSTAPSPRRQVRAPSHSARRARAATAVGSSRSTTRRSACRLWHPTARHPVSSTPRPSLRSHLRPRSRGRTRSPRRPRSRGGGASPWRWSCCCCRRIWACCHAVSGSPAEARASGGAARMPPAPP